MDIFIKVVGIERVSRAASSVSKIKYSSLKIYLSHVGKESSFFKRRSLRFSFKGA